MPPRTPQYWAAVTKSDTTRYTSPSVGLYVEGTGDLVLVGNGGEAVTLTGVAAKSYVWGDWRQVMSTGTTATGIFRMVG